MPTGRPEDPPGIAPLQSSDLDRIIEGCVLVAVPGMPYQQGVLVEGDITSSTSRQYLVACATVPGRDSATESHRGHAAGGPGGTGLSDRPQIRGCRDLGSGIQSTNRVAVLPFTGEIVAAAAPLAAAGKPLLVVTRDNAYFVDPVNFENAAEGFDIQACFRGVREEGERLPQLDPGSLWARSSGDGALYAITGAPTGPAGRPMTSISITVDQNGIAMVRDTLPLAVSMVYDKERNVVE